MPAFREHGPTAAFQVDCTSRQLGFSQCRRVVASVPSAGPATCEVAVAVRCSGTAHGTLSVNGRPAEPAELPCRSEWAVWRPQAHLRAGVNTVEVASAAAARVDVDYLEVPCVGDAPGRGAGLGYSELEAEDAATNGQVIGPDFTFTHPAPEASGRRAVTLAEAGHYVEFTVPQGPPLCAYCARGTSPPPRPPCAAPPAPGRPGLPDRLGLCQQGTASVWTTCRGPGPDAVNAMSFRYSIPDSPAGGGLE
eukprot:gene6948-6609_t